MLSLSPCNLCPRLCHARRERAPGACGCGETVRVARAGLHFWEEPCLSGTRGSGAVFFSGCTLRCRFCQNAKVSLGGWGREVSGERLAEIFLELQEQGAHNVNLVTATQYVPQVIAALARAKSGLQESGLQKPGLKIPVVYNCGGYERVETVRALKGSVDIFLPDLKYCDETLSARYAGAPDYIKAASEAVREMVAQAGPPVYDGEGMLQSGVIVRHLVLPGARRDSIRLLRWMEKNLPKGGFLLSLMSQYTPYRRDPDYPVLNRRLTTFEYRSVVEEACRLGLTDGYMQERTSAREEYTPPFDGTGV